MEYLKYVKKKSLYIEIILKHVQKFLKLLLIMVEIVLVRKMKMIVPEFRSNNSKYEEIDKELDEMRTK